MLSVRFCTGPEAIGDDKEVTTNWTRYHVAATSASQQWRHASAAAETIPSRRRRYGCVRHSVGYTAGQARAQLSRVPHNPVETSRGELRAGSLDKILPTARHTVGKKYYTWDVAPTASSVVADSQWGQTPGCDAGKARLVRALVDVRRR